MLDLKYFLKYLKNIFFLNVRNDFDFVTHVDRVGSEFWNQAELIGDEETGIQ